MPKLKDRLSKRKLRIKLGGEKFPYDLTPEQARRAVTIYRTIYLGRKPSKVRET